MGTVHLTNGHHGLYIRGGSAVLSARQRIIVDHELLNRPILDRCGNEYRSPVHSAIRAALQGLMELPNFDAAVSFQVVEKTDGFHIARPHRVWGEITLDTPDNVVVGFSHDSRYENRAFYSLFEWLEDGYRAGELSDEAYAQFCAQWSFAGKWLTFFEFRIRTEIDRIRAKAEKLRKEARAIENRAGRIKAAFG